MVQLQSGSSSRSEPVHRLTLPSRVFCTEFSPFSWSSNLIAVGLQSSVTIGQCWFPEEDSNITDFRFDVIQEIHHDTRVQSIAWSPKTSLVVAPKVLQFCTSGTDHKIRLFTSDLSDVNVRILKGHTDYINSLVFEPEKGEIIVTGSDDQTAKVWEDGECIKTLYFKSPVMSVHWHQEELGKIVISQKSGLISLYNSSTMNPILSVDSGVSPLLSSDWSLPNSLILSAAASSELIMFDLSTPSMPTSRRHVHNEGTRYVRCSRHNDSLVATSGRPNNYLKVWHSKSNGGLLSCEMVVVGGLSWHLRLPYLAVGGDREIQLFRVMY